MFFFSMVRSQSLHRLSIKTWENTASNLTSTTPHTLNPAAGLFFFLLLQHKSSHENNKQMSMDGNSSAQEQLGTYALARRFPGWRVEGSRPELEMSQSLRKPEKLDRNQLSVISIPPLYALHTPYDTSLGTQTESETTTVYLE